MIAILVAIFIVVGLPVIFVIAQYNALVALKNYIRESWSDVDVELKRRYDLIPNLVATVKGYATHEREVFERVTELRNRCAANNGAVADQSRDETQLVDALKQMLVVVENYPQLKADQNFLSASKGAGQHGRPHPGCAPILQRQRPRLPQQVRNLSEQPRGENVRLQIRGRFFQRATVGSGRAERGFRHGNLIQLSNFSKRAAAASHCAESCGVNVFNSKEFRTISRAAACDST
jgi:hypothetical protein